MTIEGGIITTISGKHVTSYVADCTYWENVVVRDEYVQVYEGGTCDAYMDY
jgi:hypothetical protein